MPEPSLIVALDTPELSQALAWVKALPPKACRLKVGMELFTAEGPKVIDALHALGFEVFLDLKFHDIPNTAAHAVKQATEMGVWMVNVHAAGGARMLEAVRNATAHSKTPPHLIAVTVLTSFSESDWQHTTHSTHPLIQQVEHWTQLSIDAGLDGVVCSAQDLQALKKKAPADFIWVVPGIRLATDQNHDQARILTPEKARAAGATHLVVGRPITQAPCKAEALQAFLPNEHS